MTDSPNNTADKNTELTDFTANTTDSEDTAIVEHDTTITTKHNSTSQGVAFDLETIDDPHLRDLVTELPHEKVMELIESLGGEKNIVDTVAEATSDDELISNIESVNQHTTTRPSLVEAAGEYIADAFGCEPFELTLTEPDNDFQPPMVCLDVNDDVIMTENPVLNAELLVYATRMEGVTESGQRNVFNSWRDAIGGETVVEFKRGRDPDALGFTIPSHIPATGDADTRTAITEIPYIGEKTARDIHPDGEIMSVEDYAALTPKQLAWVQFPVDNSDYDNQRVRGIARGIVEHTPASEDPGELLGKALNMMDRRESSGDMAWANPAYSFGVTASDKTYRETNQEPITSIKTDSSEDRVTLTFESNGETVFSRAYWELLSEIERVVDADITCGPEEPAFLALDRNKKTFVVCAPVLNDNDE